MTRAQLREIPGAGDRAHVRIQEELGLDMLVHGESERNDMVEYFGEMLSGFAFTRNGWVQSYGSRCVKPPIIYGDVERPETHDRAVVLLRAVPHQPDHERDAHRTGDDPPVVFRARRPAPVPHLPPDRIRHP